MAAHLPYELRKFSTQCTIIRNNFKETKLASHDFKTNVYLPAKYGESLEFSKSDEDEIRKTIDGRPTFLILGRDYNLKAQVLNHLLSRIVLFRITRKI